MVEVLLVDFFVFLGSELRGQAVTYLTGSPCKVVNQVKSL